MTRAITFAGLCAVAVLAGASSAGASSLIIGNGEAKECSDAALSGKSDSHAIMACTTALELETLNFRDRARTFVNRGVLHLRQRQFEAARADFDQASSLDPNLGEAYVNRGATFVGEARFKEGVEQIDKGLSLGVKDPEKAFYNRGLADEALGDLKAAYRDYSRAAELKPDWPAPKSELARFTVKQP
jgi:tetratricopeptide (TPR) repeat protein